MADVVVVPFAAIESVGNDELEPITSIGPGMEQMAHILFTLSELYRINQSRSISRTKSVSVQLTKEQHEAIIEEMRRLSLEFQEVWDNFMASLDKREGG